MNLVEALRISKTIRRKNKISHIGSSGDGWVHIDVLLDQCPEGKHSHPYSSLQLTEEDLLADDWEAKWLVVEKPQRLKAWLRPTWSDRDVLFTRFSRQSLTPTPTDDRDWVRAPWLDEPE